MFLLGRVAEGDGQGMSGSGRVVTIPCDSRDAAQRAYDDFKVHLHRIRRGKHVNSDDDDNWIQISHGE